MGTLHDAKNYGGVGAILLLVIVGFFLIFVATARPRDGAAPALRLRFREFPAQPPYYT